jgi:hypothetical protein
MIENYTPPHAVVKVALQQRVPRERWHLSGFAAK